jgi:hypothetical protein
MAERPDVHKRPAGGLGDDPAASAGGCEDRDHGRPSEQQNAGTATQAPPPGASTRLFDQRLRVLADRRQRGDESAHRLTRPSI